MDKSFGSVVYRRTERCYEFLLVQQASDHHWDMPKGHPENEETPRETALREVLEETNYHIALHSDFSESIHYILPGGEKKKVNFFLGNAVNEGCHKINTHEIICVRWFEYTEAIGIMTFENSREVLIKANDFLIAHELT